MKFGLRPLDWPHFSYSKTLVAADIYNITGIEAVRDLKPPPIEAALLALDEVQRCPYIYGKNSFENFLSRIVIRITSDI